MKKLSTKQKKWLLKKSEKEIRRKTKWNKGKNKKRKNDSVISQKTKSIVKSGRGVYRAKAPKCFSIARNPTKTIDFFNGIISVLKNRKFNTYFDFDLSEVEDVTIDAIMYLLAVTKNVKADKILKYTYSGNYPKDKSVEKIIRESGFNNYVRSESEDIIPTVDKIMIETGTNSDGKLASKICDFVKTTFNVDKKHTSSLYKTLIELMSNTFHHAYNDTEEHLIEKVWYIYAEHIENKIKFIFLDTGEGIVSTIFKKKTEIIKDLVGKTKDSRYVLSAFCGEQRTETRLAYRGGGLKEIYGYCKKGKLNDFSVITGSGFCSFNLDDDVVTELQEKLHGTLYYWEINKLEE